MQRYFVSPKQMSGDSVTITGEDVRHIVKVMRCNTGDQIIVLNNRGRQVLCTITSVQEETVQAAVTEEITRDPELPVHVTIAQALAKGDKLDLVIQKGTELGARSFWLFPGERSVVKWEQNKVEKKLQRLRKIAKESAEQAGRLYIPDIQYYNTSRNMMESRYLYDTAVYLYEEEAKSGTHGGLAAALQSMPSSLLALIGPEGGISENEAAVFNSSGCRAVSLGPRILRSESASLYLLSALSYHYELLR